MADVFDVAVSPDEAVALAIADSRLEGLTTDKEMIPILYAVARGELDVEDAVRARIAAICFLRELTAGEFKTASVSAYERGDRAVTGLAGGGTGAALRDDDRRARGGGRGGRPRQRHRHRWCVTWSVAR